MKLRQHFMRGAHHVGGEIDLDPGSSGHIGDFNGPAAFAQHIAHRGMNSSIVTAASPARSYTCCATEPE
jgi:hypothetical protein